MVHFVQPENYSTKQGASARAIYELAIRMNYSVVAATSCNMFLLSNELSQISNISIPNLDTLVPNGKNVTYVFSGYDGTLLSNKPTIALNWHGNFPIASIQILPKILRIYSGDYNKVQKILLRVILFKHSTDKINLLKDKFKLMFKD